MNTEASLQVWQLNVDNVVKALFEQFEDLPVERALVFLVRELNILLSGTEHTLQVNAISDLQLEVVIQFLILGELRATYIVPKFAE